MVSVNQILIINVLLVLLALVIHIIGFATPGWTGVSRAQHGLWQSCYPRCQRISSRGLTDRFRAVQAMECLALIFYILAALLGILAVVKIRLRKRGNLLMGICILIAFAFAIIGVIIYGATYKNYLFYSFGLTIVAFIIGFIAGVVALWNNRHFVEITS